MARIGTLKYKCRSCEKVILTSSSGDIDKTLTAIMNNDNETLRSMTGFNGFTKTVLHDCDETRLGIAELIGAKLEFV